MTKVLTEKQLEFILNSNAKWNLAHGSVRAGKTECTMFRFMQEVDKCQDSQIYMVGHTSDTLFDNAIRLLFDCPRLSMFKPFCTWSNRKLKYKDKTIVVLGAKDEGAIGNFQGKTMSLVYCDEMTLYPISIINMIDTRLSLSHSMGFASMNPSHPNHILKSWIDKADQGDPSYYALHFDITSNNFLPPDYIKRIGESCSGLFYKRNYLGLWTLAEGAIFDFFDPSLHVVSRPDRAADYWIAGVDYGTNNPCACVLIGVHTGYYTQTGRKMWVEKEYYWNPKDKRQKLNSELADDIFEMLEPYNVKQLYIDPSAQAFQLELQRRGLRVVHANNDVFNGIQYMTNEMAQGNLSILDCCTNLIREVQGYCWDPKAAKKGLDEPIKADDHAVDALRYAVFSHKIPKNIQYEQKSPTDYLSTRFQPRGRF